ncbi:hypothetical protein BSZ35_17955 [Salinibacter sp. 10B]|uniref:hypothetical protein n=1 Tax=Salinibacter sp. 10B TaxID=1923971 RepID=UPI000CF3FECC|nr:hypothetical protein [Salinibacter sp. 10B]PQJ26819.1 hypothetical protein BSZ35_17955 [Salinibacter sp. 10B]
MSTPNRRIADHLSVVIAILMVLTSSAGLLFHDLYQDNALVASSWYGNDLVTLIVAAPLLVGALIGARQGSRKAFLVWMGMLAYTFYNYAFYLFGAAFNSLFLVYAILYTLSGFALVFGLASLDAEALYQRVQQGFPGRWIGGFMVFVAVVLGGFYVALSLQYLATGEAPAMIDAVGLHTNLIAALDLSMVVSVALLGGVWLWRRRPWGFVLAVLWNVKGAVYMLALSAATGATVAIGPSDDWVQLTLWAPIGLGCLICSVLLLASVKPTEATSEAPSTDAHESSKHAATEDAN